MTNTILADVILQGMPGKFFVDAFPRISIPSGGGFVVAWYGYPSNPQFADIFIQHFNSAGIAVAEPLSVQGMSGNLLDWVPVISALHDGGFVVAWSGETSDRQGFDVFVQTFDAMGLETGNPVRLQGGLGDYLIDSSPQVTSLVDGGFVVVWAGMTSTQGSWIFLQKFDVDGFAVGSVVRLPGPVGGYRDGSTPQIANLHDGGFVVTWTGGGTIHSWDVFVQRFDEFGEPVGSTAQLRGASGNLWDHNSDVQALSGGGFVVSWDAQLHGYDVGSSLVQIFDAYGNAVGSIRKLHGGSESIFSSGAKISATDNDGFVAVWRSGDYDRSSIYVRYFDADGATVGSQVRLWGIARDSHNDTSEVIRLETGNFLVAWTSWNSVESVIYAQIMDRQGGLVGEKIRLEGRLGNYYNSVPKLAALEDGGFIIAWSGGLEGGNDQDVFVQRFDANGESISVNYDPVGKVVVLGIPEQGAVLRADTTSINDADGLNVLSFQWFADGVAIDGAVGETFRPGFAQAGKAITVQITYTDLQGTPESLVSDATAEVPFGETHKSAVTVVLPENGYTRELTLTGGQPIDGTGNSLDNLIVGNWSKNNLSGGLGIDTLEGGGGNDTLNGGWGNDVMFGGLGNDTFIVDSRLDQVIEAAGEGNDRVESSISYTLGDNVENLTLVTRLEIDGRGNALANSISGNSASNLLRGEGGNDTLLGGGGDDRLLGGVGHDVLRCGAGGDEGYGGAGNDQLFGDGGNDTLYGGAGGDTLSGGASKDILRGDGGNDALLGDGGNDTLYGGAGRDTLTGGAGADLFVFMSVRDSPSTSARDTITDFVRGVDVIDLAGIDADTTIDGDQAFAFMGRVAFSGIAGQLILRTITGTQDSLVLGDVNGDGTADFSIRLTGIQQLAAEDFIL